MALHVSTMDMFIAAACLIVFLGQTSFTHGYAFDSLASLKKLVDQDEWLSEKIDDYLVKEEHRLHNVREQLQKIKSWSSKKSSLSESDWDNYITEVVEHPVNALNLIKDWEKLSKVAKSQSNFEDLLAEAEDSGVSIPSSDDYTGALVAISRLQRTYQVPTANIAQGTINNVTSERSMDSRDMLEMGNIGMKIEHGMALSWFELFLEVGGHEPQDKTEALMAITEIYETAQDYERAWLNADKVRAIDPNNPVLAERMHGFVRSIEVQKKQGSLSQQKFFWKNFKDRGLEHYEALCRGENINNNILINKSLMCVYRQGILPYIQYKEEIHSFSPRISLLIDVISDRQSDLLKQMAYPGLFRAQVGDPSQKIISDERVGKLNWLWDTDSKILPISQKVSDITGLSTQYHTEHSHAEAFQIVNYGMGGQYEPHYDYYEDLGLLEKLPAFLMGTGDRISTFMFYLSDVAAGGATVFPNVNVRVPPIKNAAAYWYNFDLAGETGDTRTLHAGCPVLLGQKWVGNKWIRQEGQLFKRPCALDKYAVDPIWYS